MKLIAHRASHDHMGTRASWFALGLLSGAAIALLTSPGSGRENRQMLRRRARQMGDYVTEEGGVFLRQQGQKVQDMSRKVQGAVERSRDEVQAFSTRLNDAIAHGKTAYRAAKDAKDHFAAAAVDAVDSVRQG